MDFDFQSNTADHGGAIYLANIVSTTEIVNCRFYNNHAFGFGGAIDNVSSHPIIRNCTFYVNTADREGGAIGNNGADAILDNCILWGNSPDEIRLFSSTITITYSKIAGRTRADHTGTATLNRYITPSARGIEILLQAVSYQSCNTSPLLRTIFN